MDFTDLLKLRLQRVEFCQNSNKEPLLFFRCLASKDKTVPSHTFRFVLLLQFSCETNPSFPGFILFCNGQILQWQESGWTLQTAFLSCWYRNALFGVREWNTDSNGFFCLHLALFQSCAIGSLHTAQFTSHICLLHLKQSQANRWNIPYFVCLISFNRP